MSKFVWLKFVLLAAVSCGNETDAEDGALRDHQGACSSVSCSGHGQCVLFGDRARCDCDTGYHQVSNTECVGSDPCEGVTCSNHGSCRMSESGVVGCQCADGYRANGTECVAVQTLSLAVGDGTLVPVSRVGSVMTLEQPVPSGFSATLRVKAVQRMVSLIGTRSELVSSCAESLSLLETSTPPRYAFEQLLVNPLNLAAIQRAINQEAGGIGIALTNPLVVESIESSESSLQSALDAALKQGLLSGTERLGLPTGEYSWSFLCAAAAADGSEPFLTLTIRGRLGETAYQGTISFNQLVVE